jgi:hypothetical protein
MAPNKKLLNFNKYHKLARIVQGTYLYMLCSIQGLILVDMQRFQVPYHLKAIPEVQTYLNDAFQKSRHHGDLQDLYRRRYVPAFSTPLSKPTSLSTSLLVEPRQPADTPPASDMRQLFNWATRSQTQHVPHSAS